MGKNQVDNIRGDGKKEDKDKGKEVRIQRLVR